jgi:hypothetical protein
MTAAAAQIVWLLGFGALALLWRRAAARTDEAAAPRADLAALAGLTLLLGVGGAFAWGALVAREGLERVAAGPPRDDDPARARLFLRYVQVPLPAELRATVGYAPGTALSLPRDYGLEEAARAEDVFRVEVTGPRALRVVPLVAAGSTTRVAVHAGRLGGCAATPPADAAPLTVVLCVGDKPRAALILDRDLAPRDARPQDTPLRVEPFVWRGDRFRPHHVQVAAGALLQIGAATDALPGLTVWEVPAPTGRPGLLYPPKSVLAACPTWLEGNAGAEGGFFYPPLGVVEPAPAVVAPDAFACVLPFTPPFGLEVRRLVPDVAGVTVRALWAGTLVTAPIALLLLFLAAARAGARAAPAAARVAGVATVATALAAILVTRLLWAHRLDMLRDYDSVGARVLGNEAWTVCAAAALAAAATAAWRRRIDLAALAWAMVAAAGLAAVPLAPTAKLAAIAAASLAIGTAPAWLARVPRVPPAAALAAIAAATVAAALLARGSVPVKLAAAWLLGPVVYLALRPARTPGGRRWLVAAGCTLAAVGGLAWLDTGVAAVIGGTGIALAVLAAAEDALYRDDDAARAGALRRYARPLAAVQALVVALVGAAALVAGPDGPTLTRQARHLLLVPAASLAAIAVLLLVRRRRGPAVLTAAAALALGAAWLARAPLTDAVLSLRGQSGQRVAAILDPAYALLADPPAFAKGLTAWRETVTPTADAGGQGYFGAQVLDPGVLLSIDNDYLPVLLLRETGPAGLARLLVLYLALALALWFVGGGRFPAGSTARRGRRLVVATLVALVLYQPVASLGGLPFTGIAWPGLGIDSPTDLFVLVALLLAVVGGGGDAALRRADAVAAIGAGAVAAIAAVAAVALVWRVADYARARPEPVEPGSAGTVRLRPAFGDVEAALDFAWRIQCPPDATGLPRPLLPEPGSPGVARYARAFERAWDADAAAAAGVLARARAGDLGACTGARGAWRFDRAGDACRMTFQRGWPEVRVVAGADEATCDVAVDETILRALRYPPRRPYAGARVRLVAGSQGRPAGDRGELHAGHVVVRLRPGAGPVDATTLRAGVAYADRVTLEGGVEVAATAAGVTAESPRPTRVLQLRPSRVHAYQPAEARWDTRLLGAQATPLGELSVLVTGKSVWLYRPGPDALLGDDVTTVLGSRRRHYVYGGLVPEVGWQNPASVDKSVGLDGWARAAAARWEATGPRARPDCGLLDPPEAPLARVCAPSPLDRVLECRVSLQPELETRLRHVLELTSLRPELFSKQGFHPATAASFALVRGDTGEILASGHFVPGREATAYAPATPSVEKYLVDARTAPGESGAEKADWAEPVASGSTLKPLLARAFERAAPDVAARLVLTARAPRTGCEPLLGHCPPNETLWNHTDRDADLPVYLGDSLNWAQAAVGFLGTALPGGELGFGDGPPITLRFPLEVTGARPLWTRNGATVLGADSTIDTTALRGTPMWRELEALLGRPLCEAGKAACVRAGDRRDVCAARALPLAAPSADLRHLVALGPSTFDFAEAPGRRQIVKEYFQFLRGSGKHPLGSALQLADAFNRLFYDHTGGPRYRLAASWFPAPAVGTPPPACAPRTDRTVAAGLCRALATGTAAPLGKRKDVVWYGAKTGTIDSLGDVAENRAACAAWNRAHTIAGARDQPYHLDCGGARKALNDSLLALGFDAGGVPLTFVVRYQRVGSGGVGYAVEAAEAFLDVIVDYFAPARGSPRPEPAPAR